MLRKCFENWEFFGKDWVCKRKLLQMPAGKNVHFALPFIQVERCQSLKCVQMSVL